MNRRSFLKLLGGAVALLKFDPGALVKAASPKRRVIHGKNAQMWVNGQEIALGPSIIESKSRFQSSGDGGMMQSSEGWRAVWVKDKTLSEGVYKYGATVRWVIPPAKPWCAKLVDEYGIPGAILTQAQGKASGVISCLSTNADLHLEVSTY